MKQTMKKLLTVLMVMALAIGAAQTTQGTTAQAAKKLTKADLKNFKGKYKSYMNGCVSSKENRLISYVDGVGESAPRKCITTKRGIKLLSTKNQVFKKYGKTTLYKATNFVGYNVPKKISEAISLSSKSMNMLKKDKIAVYTYSDSDFYVLMFFINKNNKVDAISLSKNVFV